MDWRFYSDSARDEYNALMEEACGPLGDGGRVTADMKSTLHRLLLDAVQAHREWADGVLHDATLGGLASLAKRWVKDGRFIAVDIGGSKRTTGSMVGIQRVDDKGRLNWVQESFDRMTWAELEQSLRVRLQQRQAADVSITTHMRLLLLMEKFPQTAGPRAACELLGVTIEEYLDQQTDAA